jgi:protein-export membrane protein SecD
MKKSQGWLTFFVITLILASIWYLYPTYRLWTMPLGQQLALAEKDPVGFRNLEKKAIKLGLDLKGGLYVVMEVDRSKLTPDQAGDAVDRALEIIRNRVDQFGVTEPIIHKAGSDKIVVELAGLQDVDRARELIGKTAQLEFKLTEPDESAKLLISKLDKIISGQISATPLKAPEKKPAPQTESQPAGDTSDILSSILGSDTTSDTTAPESTPAELGRLLQPLPDGYMYAVEEDDYPLLQKYLNDPQVKAAVPPDVQLAWSTGPVTAGGLVYYRALYVLKSAVELSGEHLTDAQPTRDNLGRWVVNFKLDREGGRVFSALTAGNIGKPLAIVLDGKVESAPVIQSRIRDRGQIEFNAASSLESARDLSIILRAGALPAPVNIIENRVIGPSLGKDSIEKGLTSAVIGGLVVLLFIAVYYRISGIIADIGLILNVLFLLAIMAAFKATLTLPGIAGIILTMGMSVDSNILIFERIREELLTGKTVRSSIDAGYKRALLTIIDAHVTTLITALVLFIFGTGPIKGFAVTLSAGIVISLFTAVLITRMIFEYRKRYQNLSI